MDQRHLTVAIFGGDQHLAQLVRSARAPEGYTVETVYRPEPDPVLAQGCRVLIWTLPGSTPHQVRELCGETVKLAFSAPREALEALSPEELSQADLLLPTPMGDSLTVFYLERLFRCIQLERERRLAVLCLDTAMNSVPDMIWLKDMDGIHVRVNQGFCSVVGKSMEAVTGQDHCTIWDVDPDDPNSGAETCKESEDAVIKAGHTLQFREQVKGRNGLRQLTVYKSPLYDLDGTPLGTVGIGRDVTRLENMTAEMDILLRGMPYAVLLRDEEGRIFDANRKFEEDFGLTKEAIVGRMYDQWAEEAFYPERTQNSEGFLEGVTRTGKRMELRKDHIYDIFDQVVGQVCIFRDVTLVRQMQDQITHNANTDFMTGLNNRRALYLYLHRECQGHPIGLFYLDLDHFKSINDLYGHDAGDEALILTAELLQENCPDDFIARMGGDEFLVVKKGNESMEKLEKEAHGLLQHLRKGFNGKPNLSKLSASIGIARTEELSAGDVEDLIRHSDAALYRAKEGGRAQYCVYREM